MHIADAKQIPLEILIIALGGTYSHTKGKVMWFKSPMRPGETTASFKIDLLRQRWHDFGHAGGQGAGGDIIDLWCEYHNLDRKRDIGKALQGLSSFQGNAIQANKFEITQTQAAQGKLEKPRFEIIRFHKGIFYPSLLEELNRRRISLDLANLYLKQVWIRDNEHPGRKINGFAFANNQKGWEISIPNPDKGKSFKTCIGSKAPTIFMDGDQSKVDIFEGFWDFLTWLQMNNRKEPSCISYVLNSVSFVAQIANRIINEKNVKSIREFLDNDDAGDTCRLQLEKLTMYQNINLCTNNLYFPFKDLSCFWQQKKFIDIR